MEELDAFGNVNPLGLPYLPNGGRMGQLLGARTAAEKKNMLKGGKEGLMAGANSLTWICTWPICLLQIFHEMISLLPAMNPIKPNVIWWKEPSLIVFFGWQPFVVCK